MSMYVVSTPGSLEASITSGAAVLLATALDGTKPPGRAIYMFVANVDCWIAQGANPTASAAAGSAFVPAGKPAYVDGAYGAKLSVIADSSSGKASLTPVGHVA